MDDEWNVGASRAANPSSFDNDEEEEWVSSNIKGFTFDDNDETPFAELSKYQAQTLAANSLSGKEENEVVITFDSAGSGTSSRVITDRVRAATAQFASILDRQERGISISDAVGTETQPILSNDPKVLRGEVAQLRRQISTLTASRFTPPHPKETVKNIFLGLPYTLELYKSLAEKTALIDEALAVGDGNAILTVSLFLKQTLAKARFHEILATRPAAVNHLAAYMEKRKFGAELMDLFASCGRYEEAALVSYRQALSATSVDERVRRIKAILQSQFQRSPDSAHLIEYVHLLERLSPVIAADAKNVEVTSRSGQTNVPQLDGKSTTVLEALLYLSYFHYGQPENLLSSPAALKKVHNLTEKQFVWVSTIARARRYQWKDCEDLVLTKGWLGGRKARGTVDVSDVVKLLHSNGATVDILQVFLPLVEPLEERESLAKKLAVHGVVVDIYVINRDRLALENYKAKLTPKSQEWLYAENALNMTNTKWKN